MVRFRIVPLTASLFAFSTALAAVATSVSFRDGSGADGKSWPQWRGSERTGATSETGWSPEGKELWRKSVGLGYSTVSIADGRLYTQGFQPQLDEQGKPLEDGDDAIWCLDANDGKEIWTHKYPAKIWAKYHGGGTNVTPAVDGDRVYTSDREGQFICLDAKNGKVHWQKDARAEAGTELPAWGFAASPLVIGDLVYLNVGKVIAYDKKSGAARWTSEDLGHAYSTPVDFAFDGMPCLAVFNGSGLNVIALKDGKRLLNYPWKTNYDVNAATPIAIGEKGERVFISSGYNHGCAMLKLGKEKIEPAWESKVMRNQMSGCVLFEQHLYGFDEGLFKCIDLEGKELWQHKGLGKGAFIIAGGKLVIVSSKGDLVIADATPKGYAEVAREKVIDGKVFWTTPVLLNGLIYIRDQGGTLVCRDHRQQASK